MKWFSNLRISKKLISSFIVTALISGIMGAYGIYALKKANALDGELYNNVAIPISQMGEINSQFQTLRVDVKDLISAQSPEDIIIKVNDIEKLRSNIDTIADSFETTILSSEVRKQFDAFVEAKKAYKPELDKVIELAKLNKDDEALNMNMQSSKLYQDEQDAIEKLVSAKITSAKEKSDLNSQNINIVTNIMLAIMLVVIVLSILVGLYISRLITRPIKKVLNVIEEMSKGHLGERANINTNDEVGQMAKVMDSFAHNLQYEVIGIMNKIAQGDVSMDIFLKDEKDEIAPALKKLVENVRALVTDANMLSNAAVEGKLETRADAAKHDGEFKKVIDGVNATLDTLVDKVVWYEAIIDAIPFPIHVTDNDMNWTYMNKSFEKLMINQGVIRDRKSCYGLACSHAGASICNTERCGIKQLHKGKAESFFEWCGMNNKQDTSYLKNKKGENVGYVEVVTDLTAIIRVNDYTKTEVKRLEGNLKLLSNGNTNFDLNIKEADEFTGEVNKQFEVINNSLIEAKNAVDNLVGDTNMLSKATTEGKLDTRADVTKHNGDFKKIVEGVNNLIDAFVEPINVTARYVEKISKGDIPAKITDTYLGDFNDIKNNLNNCIDVMNGLLSETNNLIKATQEGKLNTRGNSAAFVGNWGTLVEGINNLIDAFVAPINVTAEYVDRISKGDIPAKITNTYLGDFNEIKNNLNNCIDVMNGLLSETNNLIKATQEGKLNTRGNSTAFVGEWGTLIQGVNNLIDAFVAPINVTAMYIDRISKGDIPQKITDIYYGDFNEIKNNLNNCIDNVRLLVTDSKMLSNAAIEGNLDIRADETKHNGDFRKVVEGVNQLIEAMVKPIKEVTDVMSEISNGNLEVPVSEDYKGEFGILAKAVNATEDGLKRVVGEISEIIGEISKGNLDIENVKEFHGNFKSISVSLNTIIDSLNAVLSEINTVSDQVYTGASQVSDGSQLLSQGATEQASAIEELTSSITQIAAQTRENADNSNKAKDLALEVKGNAEQGNRHMSEMLKSMGEINESSTNISKIIKVIDEIAFQTNILALNAAVEAARAGQHGKGFAVVAEEVRNLAARSAKAAKETTALIEGSIKKSEKGTEIANYTAKALYEIVDGVSKAATLVSEIAASSDEQATGISQINLGIEQVSQVVQTNSATAEESAAASEELSSQSELLKDLVSSFKLKNSNRSAVITNASKNYRSKQSNNIKNNIANKEVAATSNKTNINLNDNEFGKY